MNDAQDSTDLEARKAAVLSAVPSELLVGGWRPSSDGTRFPVTDPATGETLMEVADGTPADALEALERAVAAEPEWRSATPYDRGELLDKAAKLIWSHRDELGLLITLEMGKPLTEALGEVQYGCDYLRWYADEAVRTNGRRQSNPRGGWDIVTYFEPVGPSLLITPWNFPLAMALRKLAPALAAGCSAVLKPAALTPLASLYAAKLMLEAGIPVGLINVVASTSAGAVSEALMADPRLRKVSFTGSTEVGQILLAQASRGILRTSMELGGNAPFMVFDDADLDAAADGAMVAKFRNNGESCVAGNRFLVQSSIAEDFIQRLLERLDGMVVGPGTAPGVQLGPMISAAEAEKINGLVEGAIAAGARERFRGEAPWEPGTYVPPIVIDQVSPETEIWNREIFGPVISITTFDTEDEAIALANDTPYGLAAYVFCQGLDRCRRVVAGLDTGMVGVNQGIVSSVAAPFGGIKMSGLGREGGAEGLAEYLNCKYVAQSG